MSHEKRTKPIRKPVRVPVLIPMTERERDLFGLATELLTILGGDSSRWEWAQYFLSCATQGTPQELADKMHSRFDKLRHSLQGE